MTSQHADGSMRPASNSIPPEHFEAKYRLHPDPWDYDTSAYERGKYAASLAALPRDRYVSALEIGCSIGVFTTLLASRCDRLLAVDGSETAVSTARSRCAQYPHVLVERRRIPDQFPPGMFDLIVLSEVGYYWSSDDLRNATRCIVDHLEPSGHLLLVHWTAPIDDAPLTGDIVHDTVTASGQDLRRLVSNREECYRLDLFERLGGAG